SALFLVYLAVAAGHCNRGLGSALLEASWSAGIDRLKSRGMTAQGMILEVDDPDLAHGDERRRRERRIAFFIRPGAVVLDWPYQQPPLSGGAPVPMKLMYRPSGERSGLDGAGIGKLVRAMYEEKYIGSN